jgi:chromosomal replication initiator protein
MTERRSHTGAGLSVSCMKQNPEARATNNNEQDDLQQLQAMDRDRMTEAAWSDIRNSLKDLVGENNFITWIAPLKLAGVDGDLVRLAAPTNFIANWVNRHFHDHILRAMAAKGMRAARIEISVESPGTSAGERVQRSLAGDAGGIAAPAVRTVRNDDPTPGATLDERHTFDNFVVGKPNALAHAAARRVAEGGAVTFNPLFLYGGVGLGKTHLMHAIAWEVQQRQPDARVLYLSAEQFMYRFVQALRERQIMDFKSMFRSVDILMVDDLQFIAGKESTQEEFFHTFNALVDQNKQIVISADRAPGEIKDLELRIQSRLQSGLVADLHPTDYELRLGILQQKVDLNSAHYGEVGIGVGVLEFLAHRITNNVRVLEGALNRLFALASLVGREITLDMAQDSLADILRSSDRKVTVEEIQRKVAEHYNIRLSDLIGPKRVRTIARPRQIAMYLSKQMTTRSLPDIGRRFGGRDHTTIMHGVRKVEALRDTDPQLSEDLDLLQRLLES